MQKTNLFEKLKDNSVKELTKVAGGSPNTTNYAGGDEHTTSPQTPGQDDWADRNNNTVVENKDIVSGPALVQYLNDDGGVRASFPNAILSICSIQGS